MCSNPQIGCACPTTVPLNSCNIIHDFKFFNKIVFNFSFKIINIIKGDCPMTAYWDSTAKTCKSRSTYGGSCVTGSDYTCTSG